MDWYELLTPHLLEVAYKVNKEMAWGREDALSVVTVLEKNGYDILGVDVWLPTNPGPTIPTPYVYDWAKSNSRSDRVPKSATGFIASFEWHPSDTTFRSAEPFFNIAAARKQSTN